MRPDETRSFDPHTLVDPDDEGLVRDLAEKFSATPEDITTAIETVGPKLMAVAIFLGCGDTI